MASSPGFGAKGVTVWSCGCSHIGPQWDTQLGGKAHSANENFLHAPGAVPSTVYQLMTLSVVSCLTIKMKVRVTLIMLNHRGFSGSA